MAAVPEEVTKIDTMWDESGDGTAQIQKVEIALEMLGSELKPY